MEVLLSNPLYLWLLAPIPAFICVLLISLRRGRQEIGEIISPHALEFFFKNETFTSKYIKKNCLVFIFRLVIYIIMVLVISGATIYYNGSSKKQDVVLAIDTSGSMLAEDIKPNRLESVKETMIFFLENDLSKNRIAVLSFSGNAYIEQALSSKEEAIKSIENIHISEISGTSIGAALKTAAGILEKEKNPKLIVLISDGTENILSEQELDKIVEAVDKGRITVDVIGIGKGEGINLPETELPSSLNDPLLREIAKKTNGVYIRAETKQSLEEAYKTAFSSTKLKIPIELTIPLIIVSTLLLLFDYVFIRLA